MITNKDHVVCEISKLINTGFNVTCSRQIFAQIAMIELTVPIRKISIVQMYFVYLYTPRQLNC